MNLRKVITITLFVSAIIFSVFAIWQEYLSRQKQTQTLATLTTEINSLKINFHDLQSVYETLQEKNAKQFSDQTSKISSLQNSLTEQKKTDTPIEEIAKLAVIEQGFSLATLTLRYAQNNRALLSLLEEIDKQIASLPAVFWQPLRDKLTSQLTLLRMHQEQQLPDLLATISGINTQLNRLLHQTQIEKKFKQLHETLPSSSGNKTNSQNDSGRSSGGRAHYSTLKESSEEILKKIIIVQHHSTQNNNAVTLMDHRINVQFFDLLFLQLKLAALHADASLYQRTLQDITQRLDEYYPNTADNKEIQSLKNQLAHLAIAKLGVSDQGLQSSFELFFKLKKEYFAKAHDGAT